MVGGVFSRQHTSANTPTPRQGTSCAKPVAATILVFVMVVLLALGGGVDVAVLSTAPPPTVVVALTPPWGSSSPNIAVTKHEGKDKNNNRNQGAAVSVAQPPLLERLSRPLVDKVLLAGNRPVGTYLCSYFPKARQTPGGGCVLSCVDKVLVSTLSLLDAATATPPNSKKFLAGSKVEFNCEIVPKASPGQLTSADIVVNHHGPIPKKVNGRPLITMFYSGESNASEGKKAKPEYQNQYDVTVSFHQFRKHYFTWTHRHKTEFDGIKSSAEQRLQAGIDPSAYLTATILPAWKKKIPAVAVFVSRCKKGGRDYVIRELGKYFPVHSFGKCSRTHSIEKEHPDCLKIPGGQGETGANRYPAKLCVFSKYQFVLALDNTRELDYVTEKVYHALLSGAVPLYDGAPNVASFLPGEGASSIIQLQDFSKTPKQGDDSSPVILGNSNTNNADVDFEALGTFLGKLSTGGQESEGADVSRILRWQADPSSWSAEFIDNVEKEEPTCGVCTEARHLKSMLPQ